ncbi:unnamed protein product [Dicrocoelium dendriticum]|nr:unnamed protein product [Dicrocoelium dendriticum]
MSSVELSQNVASHKVPSNTHNEGPVLQVLGESTSPSEDKDTLACYMGCVELSSSTSEDATDDVASKSYNHFNPHNVFSESPAALLISPEYIIKPDGRHVWNTRVEEPPLGQGCATDEVTLFQKAKKDSITGSDYEKWRRELRRCFKAELDRRVQEAVEIPPREKLAQLLLNERFRRALQRNAEKQKLREIITKMNEIAGDFNALGLNDPSFQPNFRNTVDRRIHPETHRLQKRYLSRTTLCGNDGQTFNLVHSLRPQVSPLLSRTCVEGTRPFPELKNLQCRQEGGICENGTLVPHLNNIALDSIRQSFPFYHGMERIGNRIAYSRWPFDKEWPPMELHCPCTKSARSTHCCSFQRERMQTQRKPQCGDMGNEQRFSFDWDLTSNLDWSRVECLDEANAFTVGDRQLIDDLRKVCCTHGRMTQRWSKRSLLLQRMGAMTREEKNMFYFSATRTAFILATLSQNDELPDGTRFHRVALSKPSLLQSLQYRFETAVPRNVRCILTANHRASSSHSADVNSTGRQASKPLPVYIDWCGVVRDKHGPFWPLGTGPLYPVPDHFRPGATEHRIVEMSTKYSLLHISKAATKLDWSKGDSSASWDTPRLMYDMETSPQWTPTTLEMLALCSQMNSSDPGKQDVPPSLVFESRFECGNLWRAKRVGLFEYELTLRPDMHTSKHVQWFYFAVRNAIPKQTYRFRIANFTKKTSLYSEGMQILFYSEKEAADTKRGWYRTGHNISYCKHTEPTDDQLPNAESSVHQLQWDMFFPHANDLCYMAYCYPYSFTELKHDLETMLQSVKKHGLADETVKCDVLCQTEAGNSCFLLTITDPNIGDTQKTGVVVTARVHPGETNSSWIMLGLMRFLCGNSPEVVQLRSRFVFFLVPMLNPDGVIIGNYRSSFAGHDLNRNYRHPHKDVFPTVWHTRRLVKESIMRYRDTIFCDLHGHSRKHNVFMYGCDAAYRSSAESGNQKTQRDNLSSGRLQERLLPYFVWKQTPEKFSLPGCQFSIHRTKESTGRVVFWREFELTHSFTLEASFKGSKNAQSEVHHFDQSDYMEFGKEFAMALLNFDRVVTNPK